MEMWIQVMRLSTWNCQNLDIKIVTRNEPCSGLELCKALRKINVPLIFYEMYMDKKRHDQFVICYTVAELKSLSPNANVAVFT